MTNVFFALCYSLKSRKQEEPSNWLTKRSNLSEFLTRDERNLGFVSSMSAIKEWSRAEWWLSLARYNIRVANRDLHNLEAPT